MCFCSICNRMAAFGSKLIITLEIIQGRKKSNPWPRAMPSFLISMWKGRAPSPLYEHSMLYVELCAHTSFIITEDLLFLMLKKTEITVQVIHEVILTPCQTPLRIFGSIHSSGHSLQKGGLINNRFSSQHSGSTKLVLLCPTELCNKEDQRLY